MGNTALLHSVWDLQTAAKITKQPRKKNLESLCTWRSHGGLLGLATETLEGTLYFFEILNIMSFS